MPNPPSPTTRPASRDAQWQGRPPTGATHDGADLRSRLLWISVLPPVVVLLLGAATVVHLMATMNGDVPRTAWAVAALAAAISLIVVFAAAYRATSAAAAAEERTAGLRSVIAAGQQEMAQLSEQLRHGDRTTGTSRETRAREPEPPAPVSAAEPTPTGMDASGSILTPDGGFDQRVGVFVNLARRLQSLVHREIQLLDELEAQVEDPDLLKGLFSVDHLATRIRRHAENLAVLGGAVSRRQWSRPVNVYEVLRSAVAEVEQYSRVKLVRPIEGTLQGHAVADVIHLVAELVENATRFSAPDTQVLLRAQKVTAGIAVEVEDRGLGMPREEQNRVNAMLLDPERVNIDDLLQDGRIGLYVVSALARRHGLACQVQTNIYGGIQAVIVLPTGLLGAADEPEEPHRTLLSRDTHEQQAVPGGPSARSELTASAAIPKQQQPAAVPARHAEAAPVPRTAEPAPSVSRPAEAAPVPSIGDEQPATEPIPVQVREPMPAMAAATPPGGIPSAPATTAMPSSSGLPQRPETSPEWTGTERSVSTTHDRPNSTGERPMPTAGRTSGTAFTGDMRMSAAVTRTFESGHRPAAEPPAPAAESGQSGRPQLPRRHAQTHLAPQLTQEPVPPTNPGHSDAGHDPSLMSAFQRGFDRAEEQDDDAGEGPRHSTV